MDLAEEYRLAAAAEADLADERGREVVRLRGLLARLEWADRAKDGAPVCPGCGNLHSEGHVDGCWLAAELHMLSAGVPKQRTGFRAWGGR